MKTFWFVCFAVSLVLWFCTWNLGRQNPEYFVLASIVMFIPCAKWFGSNR
jgi:hypothetical protein